VNDRATANNAERDIVDRLAEAMRRQANNAERDIMDRLAEAMRRHRHGLIRPLWADAADDVCDLWLDAARRFLVEAAAVGLAVVVTQDIETRAALPAAGGDRK
jgi:hypothetical protein